VADGKTLGTKLLLGLVAHRTVLSECSVKGLILTLSSIFARRRASDGAFVDHRSYSFDKRYSCNLSFERGWSKFGPRINIYPLFSLPWPSNHVPCWSRSHSIEGNYKCVRTIRFLLRPQHVIRALNLDPATFTLRRHELVSRWA